MKKYQAAIIGYGNIGKFLVEAIKASEDFQVAGVVRRAESLKENLLELKEIPVVSSIEELERIDVAFLTIPTRLIPEYARKILALGVNTVDSYDLHGELGKLRKSLDPIAKANNAVAVISAGWDPGTDSIIRSIFQFMTPKGITYTNFGPGMSMGHTVAVKALSGIKNAVSLTIPKGTGLHRRMVYVELEEEANFAAVEAAIKKDPYFAQDETVVYPVSNVNQLIDMGHGVIIERKGVSGLTHNQILKFEMRVNNPALTSQIMVASARAGLKQKPGCYTMIEIPLIDYIYGERNSIIEKLV